MTKNPRHPLSGFTLIELMIVVAVVGVLAAIAVPKFAELIRKSQEGSTKGGLGALRSSLTIYYGDNEGQYPRGAQAANSSILSDTLLPKYINEIPPCRVPNYHSVTTSVNNHEAGVGAGYPYSTDGVDGCWMYDGVDTGAFPFPVPDTNWGSIWIDCTHTDTRGSVWTEY